MKIYFRCTALFIVAFFMTMGIVSVTACAKKTENSTPQVAQSSQPSQKTESSPEVEATVEEANGSDMKAPQINPNKAGLITLKQCPMIYQNLKVVVSKDYNEAKIYDGDNLLQTISDSDNGLVAAGGKVPVYFMDANFDGYVDIFIGPGESRTYSTLLTWNPDEKQFDRVGELGNPTFQNFMLYPSDKTVFDGGSESAFADFFTYYTWKDGSLEKQNDLYVVNDPEHYMEYGVEAQYTLWDADEKVVLSTDKLSALPKPWSGVLNHLLSITSK